MKKILFYNTHLNPVLIKNLSRFAKPPKQNPGINKRNKLISAAPQELEDINDFDDYETDFMNVHKSHKKHSQEMETMMEKEKYHIVKQKYFKEKYPNFLTWHDKEQIKYLFNNDPEEWTVEKLSEGFPAVPEVIYKIVKGNWVKKSENKIINHDKSVQNNWELFKKGQLDDLPNDLREHLSKFTDRALNFAPLNAPEVNQKNVVNFENKRIGNEFSKIITSYEELKGKNKSSNQEKSSKFNQPLLQNKKIQGDTYLATNKKLKDKKLVTLHQLTDKIEKRQEMGVRLKEDEQVLLQKFQNTNVSPVEFSAEIVDITQNKYANQSVEVGTFVKKTQSDVSHLIYPEKIDVPKEFRKKGCTYKLNDCYYDDDGTFLYRVPGMD